MGDGKGDYFVFLGRLSADKGAHRAIAAAEKAGVTLILAGKVREKAEKEYFEQEVAPHLSDDIRFVGEVPHEEKLRLLAGARATLFPIRWNEPFGLVMIESLACGTPVLAYPEGAAPEVIVDGVTGFMVDGEAEMADAIASVGRDRPGRLPGRGGDATSRCTGWWASTSSCSTTWSPRRAARSRLAGERAGPVGGRTGLAPAATASRPVRTGGGSTAPVLTGRDPLPVEPGPSGCAAHGPPAPGCRGHLDLHPHRHPSCHRSTPRTSGLSIGLGQLEKEYFEQEVAPT